MHVIRSRSPFSIGQDLMIALRFGSVRFAGTYVCVCLWACVFAGDRQFEEEKPFLAGVGGCSRFVRRAEGGGRRTDSNSGETGRKAAATVALLVILIGS